MKFEDYALNDLDKVAQEVIEFIGNDKVILFNGSMGVGKTTLIKAICKQIGIEETASSPTFSIVNEYTTEDGKAVYHFDFYRIKKVEEVIDIAFDDYLHSGSLCLIEWPDIVMPLLPETFIKLDFSFDEEKRSFIINRIDNGRK